MKKLAAHLNAQRALVSNGTNAKRGTNYAQRSTNAQRGTNAQMGTNTQRGTNYAQRARGTSCPDGRVCQRVGCALLGDPLEYFGLKANLIEEIVLILGIPIFLKLDNVKACRICNEYFVH